jgi:N-glycosidase YbiA
MTIERFNGPYRFLSNFYLAEVKYGNYRYSSVEHAYQAAKAVNAKDMVAIANAATPGQAKKLGRTVERLPNFDAIKLAVMEDCLRYKFQSPYLRYLLVSTAPHELVEGNWWGDTFWGVCRGVGENHLGKLLMKIRDEMVEGNNGNR